MEKNQKKLAAKGIYPDANPLEKTEHQKIIKMEDQVFEITITSNWLHTRGRSGVNPYNRLKIKIDGTLRYNIRFDELPDDSKRTTRLDIQPLEKTITREQIIKNYPINEREKLITLINKIRK